ncbi:MAG: transposase [Spirochaetaceae bacterium]|nr:transposase [Spirochaetaceae bacterium]
MLEELKEDRIDNVERLETVCKANQKIKIAYELGEELWEILDIRNDEKLMIEILNNCLESANASHIRQLMYSSKMIRNRCDGIISRSTYQVS